MAFSKRCRYGMRALIDLAQHTENGSTQLNEIARRNNISVKYLEQIFAALRRSGIIGSVKGPQGGCLSCCAVCDGAFYRGKDVAVIGGGDTALDTAMLLSDICGRVCLIHRRREFRGSPTTLMRLLEKENVELVTPAKAVEIIGDDSVEGILLEDRRREDAPSHP